ncbi:MAG: GNAT family N-acetyltransferase [Gemmatimonadaceae bacterium]
MDDDRQLMRVHIATLFVLDERGRMTHVNEPEGKRAPRFFLGRTARGCECRARDDIDDQLLRELESACSAEPATEAALLPPHGETRYEDILARQEPVQGVEAGPAFCFPPRLPSTARAILVTEANAEVLRPHLEAWLPDVPDRQPMFALVVDGEARALCCSVRITALAHEAGVETATQFRGRGYAAEVVVAWANAVRAMGRMPLYSTSWQNAASRTLARKLGLILFGADVLIT